MKRVYIVRHCKAVGQAEDAPLTEEGSAQGEQLADFFAELQIDRILTSSYLRAKESIAPFARRAEIVAEVDERLGEFVLSTGHLPDWLTSLRMAFEDADRVSPGGESMRAATERGVAVINEVLASSSQAAVLVSHGALTAMMLKSFDDRHGFETWQKLSNPDVYCLTVNEDGSRHVERVWA